jgi:RNA polymerase sigma-70 factor (ECF subfamily)
MKASSIISDEELVTLLTSNQERGLSYVYELHAQALKYFAFKLINNEEEAEDIVAMCLFKFWERRLDFKANQQIKAFLYISCKNACLNFLRGAKRKSEAQASFFNQIEESEEPILNGIIETEFLNILHTEIEILPDKMKEVFKLIYFEGLKTDEIASQLGISVKTVRNQKAKAVEILKSSLLKRGISPLMLLVIYSFLDKY